MEGERQQGNPQITPNEREHPGSGRESAEPIDEETRHRQHREKALDKTLADSFPTSDPPSSIPNPDEEDSDAA